MRKTLFGFLLISLICIGADSMHACALSTDQTEIKQDGTAIHLKVLATFESQVGVKENLGANDSKEIRMYLKSVGIDKPAYYCAAFVCWGFTVNGVDNPRTAWSPSLFPKPNVVNLKTSTPQPCDVFGVYYNDHGRIAHVGIIKRWPRDSEYFISIEGNTNNNGSRNGDGVYEKRRLKRTAYKISRWLNGKEMNKPIAVGSPVQYRPASGEEHLKINNNDDVIAGIVTRVWNQEPGTVNLFLFPDCGTPVAKTSVVRGESPGNYTLV